MGIFGGSSNPFDPLVEKVTDEKNTAEDWGMIMSVCDRVGATTSGPKECLRAVIKRLNHQDPHVVMQAITLLDACANNCGRQFLLEVASREFETEYRRLLSRTQHPRIAEKLKAMLKNWAEGEFSKDPAYALIPSLYAGLRKEGLDFRPGPDLATARKKVVAADPLAVASQQEEEDIAKAIQLSLQQSGGGGGESGSKSQVGGGGGLYSKAWDAAPVPGPAQAAPPPKEERKARALYDFEAAEDNELTFKAGELLVILDDADPNWWRGSNHRGEGLFPSNFVTTELEAAPGGERKRSVVFNEEVEVQEVEQVTFPAQHTIDEAKICELLGLLHDADPTTGEADPPELPRLEEQCSAMGPLIDAELEKVDSRHAQLTRLSHQLVDSLTLYHTLMRDTGLQYPAPPQPGFSPAHPGYPAPAGYPSMQPPAQYPGFPQPGPPPQVGDMGGVAPHMQQMVVPPPAGMGGPGLPPVSMGAPGLPPNSMSGPRMAPNSIGGPGLPPNSMGGPGMPPNTMTGYPGPAGYQPGLPQQGGPPPSYQEAGQYPQYGGMVGTAPPPTPPLQGGAVQ